MLLAVPLAVVPIASCGGGAGSSCEAPREDRLDPGSQIHLLPGAPEPDYGTDPPTSGSHQPGLPREFVQREPLTRPAQVGILEAGGVLLQHRALDGDARAAIEELAGPLVYVAPNEDLPVPVVATAWRTTLRCDGVDADALHDFVREHRGRTPAGTG